MHLIDSWTLPDGTPLHLRPARLQDAPALGRLIEGLTRRDLRWRFHGAVNGVPPERLARMACADPTRELALVVATSDPVGEHLVADVRCAVDGTGRCAEFALMVAIGWRRRGIGRRALLALQRTAAQRGLRWLYGSVRADNLPMLGLLRGCGFACTPDHHEPGLISTEARTHHA